MIRKVMWIAALLCSMAFAAASCGSTSAKNDNSSKENNNSSTNLTNKNLHSYIEKFELFYSKI